jgi:hypothetical protein
MLARVIYGNCVKNMKRIDPKVSRACLAQQSWSENGWEIAVEAIGNSIVTQFGGAASCLPSPRSHCLQSCWRSYGPDARHLRFHARLYLLIRSSHITLAQSSKTPFPTAPSFSLWSPRHCLENGSDYVSSCGSMVGPR